MFFLSILRPPQVFIYIMTSARQQNESLTTNYLSLFGQSTYANKTTDCFLEATGITSGIALIGALWNNALSKTAKNIGKKPWAGLG